MAGSSFEAYRTGLGANKNPACASMNTLMAACCLLVATVMLWVMRAIGLLSVAGSMANRTNSLCGTLNTAAQTARETAAVEPIRAV